MLLLSTPLDYTVCDNCADKVDGYCETAFYSITR